MNRRVLIFVVLIALLFTFVPFLRSTVRADCPETTPAATTEATGMKGAISAASVNLRAEPATTSASLAILHANDVVRVVGRNADGTWAMVSTSAGVTGWLGSAYVVMLEGKFSDVPVVESTAAES